MMKRVLKEIQRIIEVARKCACCKSHSGIRFLTAKMQVHSGGFFMDGLTLDQNQCKSRWKS
jgi:hypothetical protein